MQVILKDLSLNMEFSEKSAHVKQGGGVKKTSIPEKVYTNSNRCIAKKNMLIITKRDCNISFVVLIHSLPFSPLLVWKDS